MFLNSRDVKWGLGMNFRLLELIVKISSMKCYEGGVNVTIRTKC